MQLLDSKSLLAKLMATENLVVEQRKVQTAMFDVKSRVLTIPQLDKSISGYLYDLFVGHEVGHALYTTMEHIEKEDFRKIQGYMNVVEDVRIEKKIKNKYPGLRKAFITAYKQLNEKDFFGIADQDLSKILLIDRINLYYKCGFNCGVKFTPEEMELVRRVDRCDSMEDVYQLAREIYAYAKEERDAKMEEMKKLAIQNGEDPDEEMEELEFDNFMDDPDDFDNDPDYGEDVEDDNQKATKTSKSEQISDEQLEANEEKELESKTQRAFQERLDELADTETIVQNFTPKLETTRNPIISTKTILAELRESLPQRNQRMIDYYSQEYLTEFLAKEKSDLAKFKTDSMRVVNYLVKEFEMRDRKSTRLNSSHT